MSGYTAAMHDARHAQQQLVSRLTAVEQERDQALAEVERLTALLERAGGRLGLPAPFADAPEHPRNVYDFLRDRVRDLELSAERLPESLAGELATPPPDLPYWLDVEGRPIIAPRQEREQDAESLALVLETHQPDFYQGPDRVPPCPGCGLGQGEYITENIDDCPVLRALAWRFREHPDWREAWTPVPVLEARGGERR